jgi:hypothetical protein
MNVVVVDLHDIAIQDVLITDNVKAVCRNILGGGKIG